MTPRNVARAAGAALAVRISTIRPMVPVDGTRASWVLVALVGLCLAALAVCLWWLVSRVIIRRSGWAYPLGQPIRSQAAPCISDIGYETINGSGKSYGR